MKTLKNTGGIPTISLKDQGTRIIFLIISIFISAICATEARADSQKYSDTESFTILADNKEDIAQSVTEWQLDPSGVPPQETINAPQVFPLDFQTPEEQVKREALVKRLKIFPGDVTVPLNQSVVFAAVAYDDNNTPVGGVNVNWRAYNMEQEQEVRILRHGEFVARLPGVFLITAEVGKHKETVTVTVPDDILNNLQDSDKSPISGGISKSPAWSIGEDRRAFARKEHEYDETNYETAFELRNKRGKSRTEIAISKTLGARSLAVLRQGLGSDADNAGSSSYQLTVPIVNLPGRGLDISLNLYYNSGIWHSEGNGSIRFNPDGDWISPGWSLGFGKLMHIGGTKIILFEADGTRHPSPSFLVMNSALSNY